MQQPPFSLLIMIPWANIHCSFFSARAVFFLSFFFLVFHYACGGSKNPSHLTFFLFVFFFFFFFLTWLRNNWSTSFSAAQRRCRSKYKHVYYLEKKEREKERERVPETELRRRSRRQEKKLEKLCSSYICALTPSVRRSDRRKGQTVRASVSVCQSVGKIGFQSLTWPVERLLACLLGCSLTLPSLLMYCQVFFSEDWDWVKKRASQQVGFCSIREIKRRTAKKLL